MKVPAQLHFTETSELIEFTETTLAMASIINFNLAFTHTHVLISPHIATRIVFHRPFIKVASHLDNSMMVVTFAKP